MISQQLTDKGLLLSSYFNGNVLDFHDWQSTDDCIYYFPLATLVDNGFATTTAEGCLVPYEYLYLLDEEDRFLLGVPPLYDKAIRLRGEGMLNTSSFKYKIEFLKSAPDGDIINCISKGNIIKAGNESYLLTDSQYELLKQVQRYNDEDEDVKNTDYNLRCFAAIKGLASQANCTLDSYLGNENVYVPDKIKIKVGVDEQGFTVEPAIDLEENKKFQDYFERGRKVQGQYPLQRENGERVRVVLNPTQKNNLEQLKANGGKHKSREQIKELTDHPTEFFDPDVFDLSELYSDRVIEIGVYKPKFYPFICPYSSCWIAGATVETPENGTARIIIDSEEELERLKQCIKESEENNCTLVDYDDNQIDINDARFLAEIAERQLRSPRSPIKINDARGKVLIIEENAEELGFAVNNYDIKNDGNYTLYKDPNFCPDFSLKRHQEEGIAWLQYLFSNKASGCLMADDMGLGKTLQLLYFIDWHSRKYPKHKPYLIVAPVSLLENWEKEYNRFFTNPKLYINRLTTQDVPRHYDKDVVEQMQQMDIILTNYESLRISQLNFCAVEFDIVALDEAQKVKTPGTLVTNAAKALKSNFKIAMTGTPVENSLLDLWCIMDYCVPGLLGNAKSFAARYQNPLKNEDTDIVALGNEVHNKLGIFFMRRLKKDAAKDLPEKIELKQQVAMPTTQEQMYKSIINSYVNGDQHNMLLTIMDMREVSEHPYLFDSSIAEHETDELIDTSARLQATISFLDDIQSRNEKAIVFAERKETQKMLQRICYERYGLITKIINGDTPTNDTQHNNGKLTRQASIDEFQSMEGFNVIIMSPIAAGMGLNVTAANHVIHYSRHWNPAKESQATDRAYRIGQEKDVYVYYPMAISHNFKSFDETLDELLSRKTTLATSTIFPTERIEVKPEELGQMLFGVNTIV